MKQSWKQIAGAFLMGFCIPVLVMRMQSIVLPDRPQDSTTAPTQEQTLPITESQPSDSAPLLPTVDVSREIYIPVRLPDGTIQVMELENYVACVVLAEMPADFEIEALKAQAVVARTYTLKRVTEEDRHPGGTVCTDYRCCQAFTTEESYLASGGLQESVDKIRGAVAQTMGQVLTYNGALADATYFSCSGGRTEDALAVWGSDIPYLQSVDSPGEEWASVYSDSVYFPSWEFAGKLQTQLYGTPESWLGEATYTSGGGVATMVIGGVTYTGTELRQLLGLRSTNFTMVPDENGITVSTLGNGHRVGMSQYGADAMALAGSTYDMILTYYYGGTTLEIYAGYR
ncbi:MAG: stage II sporulation protein D [Faecousia sp.]